MINHLYIAQLSPCYFLKLMQILAYILRFGMAGFSLTCPFSLDWKKTSSAHALSDVNADQVTIIGGADFRERRM